MKNKGKTHYATVDRANESDNQDWWSDTACGLRETESPLTDQQQFVTCKKCLDKLKPKKRKIVRKGNRIDIYFP